VLNLEHDDAMETKAHKTFMHWFKMGQCARKEFRVYLNNNVIATNGIKNKTP
jgi:hypothetical protein